MRTELRKAFTLIELLTVIAISAILMTLIVIPVVQSFNMLRSGLGWSEAQQRGRILVEQLAREIGNANGVRNNTGQLGTLAVVVPSANGAPVEVLMSYTKLDVVRPAEGEPDRGPNGGYINPRTGKEDPTLQVPMGQVVLPAAPGASYVRYFIGLRAPTVVDGNGTLLANPYNNPYDAVLMRRNVRQDNFYVLYRAEYVPYVRNPNYPQDPRPLIVNTKLFQDVNNDNVPDDWDDPYFFSLRPATDYNVGTGALTPAGQAKAARMHAWLLRATVQTDVTRYDMIQPVLDDANKLPYNGLGESSVVRDANGVPELMPLVQFRPTRVTSEPAEGMAAVRQSEEAEGMAAFAPDVLETKYAAWVNQMVRTWPAGWDASNVMLNDYVVGRPDPFVSNGPFKIFWFDPDLGLTEQTGGLELFDVTAFQYAVSQKLDYPFSRALNGPNLVNQRARDMFTPYRLDSRAGRILANFGINQVGLPGVPPPPDNRNNLPNKETGPEIVPATDVNTPGNFYDPAYSSINKLFNKIWNDYPQLRPNIHRFIDLRLAPNPNDPASGADDTPSPLNPNPAVGFSRARIVPGSEEVYGPDQLPGPNYRNRIRYTRTTRTPGPNQYRINYVNLREPDYSQLGLPTPPAAYDPQNFMSAVYQPRFKAGYIQLNSDPNVPLPADDPGTPLTDEGQIQVYYKFQMSGPVTGNGSTPSGGDPSVHDVFAVDYDTRQLISVLLTIRNYPQTTVPVNNTITLRATAKVRNFLR